METYQDFKNRNAILEEQNPISNFLDSIMGTNEVPNPELEQGLVALSRDSQNLYYQLIKDVGPSLGISERPSDPLSIQLDKMDVQTQEKLNIFSSFYRLGEGCMSDIPRIPREEYDSVPRSVLPPSKGRDPNELCPGTKHYKLGLDVSRWPSGALSGEIITKVKKVTTRDPSFFERLVLIQRHFPKKEIYEAFPDAEHRLRRLFEEYLYPPTYTPEHEKLRDIEKQERIDFVPFQYRYMALFALQEIANQLQDLLKKTSQVSNLAEVCQYMKGPEYINLFGSINRDIIARAVCLGETYAIICAAPRTWDEEERELQDGPTVRKETILKAGSIPNKWWKICTHLYDKQEVADKMRYSTAALFFAYMPTTDDYRINRMPDKRFNDTIAQVITRKEKEAETDAQRQQSEKLSKLQVAMKNKILLTLLDVDKYAAADYEKFRSKYRENTLEHIEVKFNKFKVYLNSIIVRYNKAETGDYPVKYKYVQNLVNYVKQVGSLQKLRMTEPIDMKVNRRQAGGARSRRPFRRLHRHYSVKCS